MGEQYFKDTSMRFYSGVQSARHDKKGMGHFRTSSFSPHQKLYLTNQALSQQLFFPV